MEHIFGRAPKGPAPPSRGAVAGVKADMERSKDGFDPKNPNGVGMAWTHNFLNQKPWHPMSFRNRMRVWEAQTDKTEQDKVKEKAQAEFDTEQEYLKTLSYLSAAEQQRYREVQSVSFMYTKPPGLDAALARDAEAEKKKVTQVPALEGGGGVADAAGGVVAASGSGGGPAAAAAQQGGGAGPAHGDPDPQQQRAAMVERLREDPYMAMVAAREALQNNPRLAVTRHREVGAFGGYSADDINQQLLVEDPSTSGQGADELELLLQLPPEQQLKALKRIAKRRKKEEQERQLREAEAVLRAAGYDLGAVTAAAGAAAGSKAGKHAKKRSRSKEQKGRKGRREEDRSSRKSKRRRESDSGSESSE